MNSSAVQEDDSDFAPRALAQGNTLRILCLGASITYGYGSTDGNGYRYGLRGALVSHGNKVNFIGSLTHGTMHNNKVEGWSGYRITEVAQKAELSLPFLPNVVLIHVGTNDMIQNFDIQDAPKRLGSLVDRIYQVVPNTIIIVSTLLPNANIAAQANILAYNRDLLDLVAQRAASGKQITLVDMSSDWFSIADLKSDGTHPTDNGYLKMAKVFYNGIVSLESQILAPQAIAGIDDLDAQDDIGAGTALNIVCQTALGDYIPSAQSVQCGLTVSTKSVSTATIPTSIIQQSALLTKSLVLTASSLSAVQASTISTSSFDPTSSPTDAVQASTVSTKSLDPTSSPTGAVQASKLSTESRIAIVSTRAVQSSTTTMNPSKSESSLTLASSIKLSLASVG